MGFKVNPKASKQAKKTTTAGVQDQAAANTNTNLNLEKGTSDMVTQPPRAIQEQAQKARESVEKQGDREEKSAGGQTIKIRSSFDNDPKKLDFLWESGLLMGTVGALIAPGGVGKSFFALEAAIAIAACGTEKSDLLDLKPTVRGKVFYYAFEDPAVVLEGRLHAIGKFLSDEAKDRADENLELISMLGELSFDFAFPDTALSVIARCKGARLIVLDTLSRTHSYDENSNGEMAQLLKNLENIAVKTGATVLFLHHTSKGSAREGQGDQQQAARGASSLIDNARWGSFVQIMSKEEAENHFASDDPYDESPVGDKRRGFYIRYGVSKQNYAMPSDDVWYERQAGGVLMSSRLIEIHKKQQRENLRGRRNVAKY